MGLLPFGGGMGFGNRQDSDKDVNLFSMSKEDRARQRELVARQERNSMIQVILLSVCLLVVLSAFFFFRAVGGPPPKPAGAGAPGSQESDAAKLQNMFDSLTAPDVRPSPEEMTPAFEPLETLAPETIAAGIDESNLTAPDAFRRNRPTAAMCANALRYLRTHLETLKDFAPTPDRIATPYEAVQQPAAARGKFQVIQGVLERVEPDFYNFVTIDDPALQQACGVKALHLYYFDTVGADRERFYYGREVNETEPPIHGCGVPAKLHKFAVLTPTDLAPIENANLADIDTGGKPKVHMIFNLRMNALFLGDHLVLPLKLANAQQRVTVPLYLAVDPLPWRTDRDRQATLSPKINTTIPQHAHTPGALEPDPNAELPGANAEDDPNHLSPAAGSDGDWKGGAPTAAQPKEDTPFEAISPEFKELKELTGSEDAFIGIPTGNDIESIKEAAAYTHSYEAFHLCIRYLRSHKPEEIRAYRDQREKANAERLNNAAKSVANYTNVRNDPEPYYGQPYEFEAWLTMCLSPRDYWEQDFGQGTGLKAESGVRHTSTWILKDDRNDYYCVTVPHSTQEILGKDFNGDLNHLQDLNIRLKILGLVLQRLPVQKRLTLEFDTMPMFVALDMQRVVRPPSKLGQYSYWVAGALGLVFVIVLVVLYKDRKPNDVVRNKTRENMYARLRKAGKLNPEAEAAAAERLRQNKPAPAGTPPVGGPADPPPPGSTPPRAT